MISENTSKLGSYPRSIRCLRAVEAIMGGRERLAEKLGVSVSAINRWVAERSISKSAIIGLLSLSEQKFTAEDFLTDDIEVETDDTTKRRDAN